MHIISRVKSENEKGYYIVDAINEAINVGVKISFYYSELNGKKKEVLRNDVKLYTVSPFDLIWDGDYYYLTGYCDEREFVRTYRVDQIKKQLELLTEKAVKKPKGYNVSKYTAEVSRMFSTDEAIDVTFKYDLQSFFNYFDWINVSQFAKKAGINESKMRQYKNGLAFAGESTTKKILDTIKNIGAELQSATL